MIGLARILGWTLLASLLQAGVVAAAVALALRILPADRAELRHAIGLCGLLVASAAFVATGGLLVADWQAHVECWDRLDRAAAAVEPACRSHGVPAPTLEEMPWTAVAMGTQQPADGMAPARASDRTALAKAAAVLAWLPGTHAPGLPHSRDLGRAVTAAAGAIGFIWLVALLLLAARAARRRISLHRLVRESRPVSDPDAIAALAELAARLGLRSPVDLRESADVSTPCVAGVARPVVLLPAGLRTVLGDRELRAVLAHELAHVRRRDPAIVAMLRIAAGPLFFNPFIGRLSSWIGAEREAACDRIGADLGARSRRAYAETLLVLEGFRSVSAASGRALPLLGETGLARRLRRLLDGPARVRRLRAGLLVVAALAVLSAGLLARGSVAVAGLGSWAVMVEDIADRESTIR